MNRYLARNFAYPRFVPIATLVLAGLVAFQGCDNKRRVARNAGQRTVGMEVHTKLTPAEEEGAKRVLNELGIADVANASQSELEKAKAEKEQKKAASNVTSKTNSDGGSILEGESNFFDTRRRWIRASQLPREVWEIQYLGNRPVGYTREVFRPSTIGSEGVLRLESQSLIRVMRDGERLNQVMEILSIEELDGKVRSIETTVKQGDSATRTSINFIMDRLRIRTESPSGTNIKEMKWNPQTGGPFAVTQSMLRKPMKESEVRRFRMFDAQILDVVDVELISSGTITTPMLDGKEESLIEIRVTTKRGGEQQEMLIWANDAGELRKGYSSRMDIRSF